MKFIVTLIFTLLIGCTAQPSLDPPIDFGDASITYPSRHVCQPAFIDRDVYNCGSCGNVCSSSDTDICIDGECRCGRNPPCTGLSDCRRGACIVQDPEGSVCEFSAGWCPVGYECIEHRCTFVYCVPEVCDGFDNDCDGTVDNVGSTPLAEFCYSGPSSEPITLPCQSGIRTCISGAWTECVGEVAPITEVGVLGCDGIDNDCDGCVDGVDISGVCVTRRPEAFDVLFIIDMSGSMLGKIAIVKQAVRLFSTRLSANPAFRWGIVKVPGPIDGLNELFLDLSTFATFEPALRTLTGTGGVEPQWDAVYEAANGEMGVSWRPGSVRIIILFTDEQGQTTRPARSLSAVNEAAMCAAMTHGEVFVPVVSTWYEENFNDCATPLLTLPGGTAGSGAPCTTDSECLAAETCEAAECVTAVVTETANELGRVISDPCGTP